VTGRLTGKRVLVTSAHRYMGPSIVELFRTEGATVVADERAYEAPGTAEDAVAAAEIADRDWAALFDALVHPLMRLVRAALPPMIERGSGKVIAVTSAAPLRGIPGASAYCAARGAQNAFIKAVGLEVARHGVQVNAVAQNYVENDTYYPPEMLADADLVARMERQIPARRIAEGWESAELALFLASDRSDFVVAQVIPFAGGWA
jgi:2-keto-3-deoxy-L-fuconate dehydrogenase